jgi:hypothetical protein
LTRYPGGNRTTEHDYYNDGLVKEVRDLHYGANFLRKYEYDQAAQLTKAYAGGPAQSSTSPYSMTYGYDAWGHTISRQGSHWSQALPNYSTTYTDPSTGNATDRDANMTYDPAGNVKGYSVNSVDPFMHYNAASQLFTQFESGVLGLIRLRENYYDGEGEKVYFKGSNGSLFNGSYTHQSNNYLIRSSVLGGKVLAEFSDDVTLPETNSGKYYSKSYVYLKGVQLAFQAWAHRQIGEKNVIWQYHNPVVGNYFAESQLNNSSNQPVNITYGEMTFDPIGSFVGTAEPINIQIPAPFTFVMGQSIDTYSGRCFADYVETPCTVVQQMLNNGSGTYAPLDNTQSIWNPNANGGRGGYELALFQVDWDNGFYGFVPTGARLSAHGNGAWYNPQSGQEGRLKTLVPKIDHLPTTGAEFPKRDYSETFHPIISDFLNNQDCVDAFAKVGVDLIKLLTGNGIRIGPAGLFKNQSKNKVKELLGLTETGFSNYEAAVKTMGIDNALTLSRPEFLVENSLPTILLASKAVIKGTKHLAQTLAHELVHAGGIHGRVPFPASSTEKAKMALFSGPASKPHDLDHIEGFDELIKACTGKYR